MKCAVCQNEATFHELEYSENYPTAEAALKAGLSWIYYCQEHIPRFTPGRICGPQSRGCRFCGNTLALLLENREYRLWACQPLKGREGCGRLLLEDAREGLGATWYYAEQNEPDGRRL